MDPLSHTEARFWFWAKINVKSSQYYGKDHDLDSIESSHGCNPGIPPLSYPCTTIASMLVSHAPLLFWADFLPLSFIHACKLNSPTCTGSHPYWQRIVGIKLTDFYRLTSLLAEDSEDKLTDLYRLASLLAEDSEDKTLRSVPARIPTGRG